VQQRGPLQRQREQREQRGELRRLVQLQRRAGPDLHDLDLRKLLRRSLPRRERGVLLPQRRLLRPRIAMLLHRDFDRNSHHLCLDVRERDRIVELPGHLRLEPASTATSTSTSTGLLECGTLQRKRLQRRQRFAMPRLLLVPRATGVDLYDLDLRKLLRRSLPRRQRSVRLPQR
jgi:hypothetical protein